MKNVIATLLIIAFVFFEGKAQTVKFGSVIPKDSPWEEGLDEYISHVRKASGEAVTFKKYLGGQMGGEVEMIKSVAMGTLDGGAFSIAAIAEALNLPQLQVFELPFLFASNEEADYVMNQMFETMAAHLDKKGLKLVMWGTNGWRSFGSRRKAIKAPSDLRGMKMRSQESDVYVNFYRALGATPVPISTPDVLVALKSGMVDGFDQTPIFSVSTGWITSIKFFTLSRHIYQPGAIVVSKRFYNKLSNKSKKALMAGEVRKKLQARTNRYVREADADIVKNMESDFGVTLIRHNDAQRKAFRNATQIVYKQMEGKVGKGLIEQVQGVVKEYRER